MNPLTRTELLPAGLDPAASPVPPVPAVPPGTLDLTGKTLGDFHVLRHLGQGGMGQVYLAEQLSLKRKVALKILRPEMAADHNALERFRAEAAAVARITHANIVQVYTVGSENGIAFMALEYVEGRNLREYLLRKGPPEVAVALRIMIQVASALQRAGELGIVHRDIKPENILITRKGEVKVADFGLSRCLAPDPFSPSLTQSGVTMGTPLYMSPEQVEGKPVDVRSDIYSFGITCYHLLAGHPPFRGASAFEISLQHVQHEPVPLAEVRPDLPATLCGVVQKMMAKKPEARYQSGRDLLRDLLRLRETLGASSSPSLSVDSSPSTPLAPPPPAAGLGTSRVSTIPLPLVVSQRRPVRTVLAVAASLLLAGAAGLALAWARQGHGQAESIPVARADEADPLAAQHQEEQNLRAVLDRFLAGPFDPNETLTVVGLSVDLGLLYLKQDRLVEAEQLFLRMDKYKHNGHLRALGLLGRGIVQALRNSPEESNQLFVEVFVHRQHAPAPKQRGDNLRLLQMGRLRPWLARAVHYNLENGLDARRMPERLLQITGQS